jgi:hypothetical protein
MANEMHDAQNGSVGVTKMHTHVSACFAIVISPMQMAKWEMLYLHTRVIEMEKKLSVFDAAPDISRSLIIC